MFLPSRAGFCCSKEYLYRFEQEQPTLEPLLKALLRTYEGIFDNEVNISERTLARLLNADQQDVVQKIQTLDYYNIIKYTPRKDSPQVFFPYSRISADQITLNHQAYQARKARYLKRVRAMIRYAYGKACRSQMMQEYFGEKGAQPCGICDYCLQQKQKQKIRHNQLLTWLGTAKEMLRKHPLLPDDLRKEMKLTRYETDQLIELGLREEIFLIRDDRRIEVNPGYAD